MTVSRIAERTLADMNVDRPMALSSTASHYDIAASASCHEDAVAAFTGANEAAVVVRRLHAEIERGRATLSARSDVLAARQRTLAAHRRRVETEAFDVFAARDVADAMATLHVELEVHATAWDELHGRARALAQLVDEIVGDGSAVGPRTRRLIAVS